MPHGLTEAPFHLSQVLPQDFSFLQFPGKLTLLEYVDDILGILLSFQEAPIKDSIYFL